MSQIILMGGKWPWQPCLTIETIHCADCLFRKDTSDAAQPVLFFFIS